MRIIVHHHICNLLKSYPVGSFPFHWFLSLFLFARLQTGRRTASSSSLILRTRVVFPTITTSSTNNWYLNCYHAKSSLLRVKSNTNMMEPGRQINRSDVSAPFRLAYVTDAEGNLDYFLEFVRACPILNVQLHYRDDCDANIALCGRSNDAARDFEISSYPERNSGHQFQTMELDFAADTTNPCSSNDNYHFVFGGDAVDKGAGDIRLARCLVEFKKRYPDRVFLLVGNRDLNKLRYSAELSNADLARDVHQITGPHWDPSAPTLVEYLTRRRKESSSSAADGERQQRTDLQSMHTRLNKLKYMLQHTLGCPNTFEFRRQELSVLHNRPREEIGDEQVVDDLVRQVQPEGSLHDYLQHAQVAVVIGNTLFCHGAVDKDTMKFVPDPLSKFENPTSKPAPWKMVSDAREWVDGLNEFYRLGLDDYAQRPHWNEDFTSRGGESLLALQNRPAMWGRSIVSNCYGDGGCITTKHATRRREDPQRLEQAKTDPLCFEAVCSDPRDARPANWLLEHGIQRVVVGHKPTGDCPSVLSSAYTGVEIVSADTSFSDTSADDNRGVAVGVVQLVGPTSKNNQLRLSGSLRDGRRYSCAFAALSCEEGIINQSGVENKSKDSIDQISSRDNTDADPFLGRQLKEDEWWVKVKTVEEELYCLTRGNGRTVEYKFVSNLREDMLTGSHDRNL